MFKPEGCTVGILRPPETSFSARLTNRFDPECDIFAEIEAAHLDEQIKLIAEIFREAADDIGLRVKITQHQLHNVSGPVVSQKRARHIRQNDILVALNASPSLYAFATGAGSHPLQRSVIAFPDRQHLMDSAALLGTGKIDLVIQSLAAERHTLNRVFVMYTPLNTSLAADEYASNLDIAKRACLYPDLPLKKSRPNDSLSPEIDTRLGSHDCRGLLVEESADAKDGPASPYDLI